MSIPTCKTGWYVGSSPFYVEKQDGSVLCYWRQDTFFGFLELFEIAKPWTGTLCDGDAESHYHRSAFALVFGVLQMLL